MGGKKGKKIIYFNTNAAHPNGVYLVLTKQHVSTRSPVQKVTTERTNECSAEKYGDNGSQPINLQLNFVLMKSK